ncbi:MAG: type II toxin-antitoxin system RelE/ParE family toxin [Pyrinomonadaceae bacterium]
MNVAIFLLPQAEADIDAHCVFIAKTSLEKAINFDRAVFDSFDRLSEMPLVGSDQTFRHPKLLDIRMWFVKGFEKYLIFYRPFGNYTEIIRILHSSQDRELLLSEEMNS